MLLLELPSHHPLEHRVSPSFIVVAVLFSRVEWRVLFIPVCYATAGFSGFLRCLWFAWFRCLLASGMVLQLLVLSALATVDRLDGIGAHCRCGPPVGSAWSRLCVQFSCDNLAVVQVLNSGPSKSPEVMHLLRPVTLVACRHNFVFSAIHTPGRVNVAADALSRLHLQEFRYLVPDSSPVLRPIPPTR